MSAAQRSTSLAMAPSWVPAQVIARSRAKARTASSTRPSARSRAACRCQSTLCRVTSVIAAEPCRSRSSANSPPRSTLASCRSSPASTSLAPLRRASASSSPVTRLSSIAASSTTTSVRASQVARPFLSRNSSECTVADRPNPSAFRSCATLLVGPSPTTA